MLARAHKLLVAALLGAVAALPSAVHGQELAPPPFPVFPGTEAPAPPPGAPLPFGPAADLEALPSMPDDLFAPPDMGKDGWGPYGPPMPEPGFYASAELDVIRPVLRNRLTNDQPIPGTGNILTVPGASLSWTVTPWLEVGYRLPRNLGQLSIGYRMLSSQGSASPTIDGIPSAVRSRLTMNMIDLDYATSLYAFLPRWEWQWRIGARLADVFFDNRDHNAFATQDASNNFRGAGPHARLDLYRHVALVPGLSLFGRSDLSVVIGRISQKFYDLNPNAAGGPILGTFEQNGQQAVPVLIVEGGVNYTPPTMCNLHLAAGYFFEQWWYVGQFGEEATSGAFVPPSRGQFGSQGLFLRARLDF